MKTYNLIATNKVTGESHIEEYDMTSFDADTRIQNELKAGHGDKYEFTKEAVGVDNNFYNVTIRGQQKHIRGNNWENQTERQVNAIIAQYWDSEHCNKPLVDNPNSQELNNDQMISIELTK